MPAKRPNRKSLFSREDGFTITKKFDVRKVVGKSLQDKYALQNHTKNDSMADIGQKVDSNAKTLINVSDAS